MSAADTLNLLTCPLCNKRFCDCGFEIVFFFLLLQEVFPAEYDLSYDADMQLLVWEFLSKLEQLMPVPDLSQVLSDITVQIRSTGYYIVYYNCITSNRLCHG